MKVCTLYQNGEEGSGMKEKQIKLLISMLLMQYPVYPRPLRQLAQAEISGGYQEDSRGDVSTNAMPGAQQNQYFMCVVVSLLFRHVHVRYILCK